MEKLKQYYPILVFILIIILAFIFGQNRSDKETSGIQCKFEEITVETVRKLPGGSEFDEKMINQINEETPYCRDFCIQQLEYSTKYDDWFAEEDLRKTCADLGIPLPVR